MFVFDEVGSEYWGIETLETPVNRIPEAVFTASGRAAQSLIVRTIESRLGRKGTALLPAYTCQHIVEPFAWNGWEVEFYNINHDLTVDADNMEARLRSNPDCVIVQSYYGFPTAENVICHIEKAQKNGTFIIEDITHSFLSGRQFVYENSDYLFCSLRKWSGLSDGGFALSRCGDKLPVPQATMNYFSQRRRKAREVKAEYRRTGNEALKKEYLRLYADAEDYIDSDVGVYGITDASFHDYQRLDTDFISKQRRENYLTLLSGLDSAVVHPVFFELPEYVVPVMFPIYVPRTREKLRNYLIQNRVYCPVHWPAPVQLTPQAKISSDYIYSTIMSIPCDQRYGNKDMQRVINLINAFSSEEYNGPKD